MASPILLLSASLSLQGQYSWAMYCVCVSNRAMGSDEPSVHQ